MVLARDKFSLNVATDNTLKTVLENVQVYLQTFANDSEFTTKMQVAFGDEINVIDLHQAWKSGDFSSFPMIEILPTNEINGANGAFAAATNTIYLAQEYISQNVDNPHAVVDVLLEEIGHSVDALLNASDSPGDEGAIFSALVQGESLDRYQLEQLKAEDDTAIVTLDGQITQIEQASVSDSGGFEGSQETITLESNGGGVAQFRYEHFTIPDNFIIRYEGQNILETGFVGGSQTGQVQIPEGNSNQLEVIVATNDQGTAWNYDVTTDNCADTTPLNIELAGGEFEDTDGDGDCDGQGTIYIGHTDGIARMLRVENATAEYDEKKLKITGGTVFSEIGAGDVTTKPLFQGDFEIPFNTGTTSLFKETGSLANEFQVGGLDIDFSSLTINQNGLALGAKFELVEELGLPDFPFSGPDALLIKQNDVDFGPSVKFSSPNFKDFKFLGFLPIEEFSDFSIEYVAPEDKIKIQGKLAVDLSSKPRSGEIVANLAGDNFIEIKGGKADFKGELTAQTDLKFPPKGWGLRELKLNLDTQNKDVGGGAKLTLPFGRTIKIAGDLGFKVPIPPLDLNKLSLDVDNLNLPVPQFPLVFFQGFRGAAENFAQSDPDPIEYSGGVSATLGPQILGIAAIRFDADGKLNSEQFSGTGTVTVVNDKLLKGQGTSLLNWNNKFYEYKGSLVLLDGLIQTNNGFKTDSHFNISMSGNASVGIPNSTPLFGGAQIASGNFLLDFSNDSDLSNDFAGGWGTLDIQKFGFEASIVLGVKGYFDGRFERIGAKNIPSTGSFEVTPDTEWILLGADWENEVTGDVPFEIETPDGTILTEADFAANNIAIVDELTDSTTKVAILFNPIPGIWDIKVADESGLGQVEYSAAGDSEAPTIEITAPAEDVSSPEVTINYEAFDSDSDAEVSLFYDTDNEGFDGILIADALTETDGAGSFVWNTEGVATGDYFIYGMVMDENNAPVFDYSEGKVSITEEADLSVTQTVNTDSVGIGENFTYTVTVTNNGSIESKGVTLTQTLPEEVTFVSASVAPSEQSDNTLSFDLENLASSATETIDITVTAPTAEGNITSNALITSDTFDPDATNDVNILTTTVEEIPPEPVDLSISRTDNPDPIDLGENFTYTLTIANNGSSDATGVVVTENLPSVVNFVEVTTSQGNASQDSNGNITANLDNINSGEEATVTITLNPFGAGDLRSSTSVISNETDLNPLDNELISTTAVNPVAPAQADLELIQTVDNANPQVGDEINFTLTLTNNGPGIASGIQVTDLLPSELSFVSATPEQGTYDSSTGIWDVGNIRDNLSRTLNIVANVETAGAIANTAEIIGVNEADPDSTPNNNDPNEDDQATVSFTINGVDQPNPPLVKVNDTAVTNPFESYGSPTQDVTGTAELSPSNQLNLSGNLFRRVEINSNITPNTILRFDFAGNGESEIQGIGFDNNNVIGADDRSRFFQVDGSQKFGIEDTEKYIIGTTDGFTQYSIRVGDFFTGEFDFLTIANDDDQANPDAQAQFRNIELFEPAPDLLDVSINGVNETLEVLSYGGVSQNPRITATVSNNKQLDLVGNGFKRLDISGYQVTEDTLLNFNFNGNGESEIQGIGFDNNNLIGSEDKGKFFQVDGSQNFGIDELDEFIQGSVDGFTQYSIPVGDFFTGEFDFLTFGNDDDQPNPNAVAKFQNIELIG